MKKIYILFILSLCGPFAFGQQSALLEKYRSLAVDYSHDLKAAEKNLAASIELEKSARADLKPKLSGDASFQYTGNPLELNLNLPGMDKALEIQGRDTKYGASLTLLQPIYTGGRLLESIRMAQHQHSLATHQKEQLLSDVCFQTDIQYWNTVARQEIVSIVTDYRNSIASLAKTIRERVEVSLINPQDLLMAEVKLNDADFQLLQARKEFETGVMAFNSLIGLPLEEATPIDSIVPPMNLPDSAQLSLARLRPEIKMAHDRIKMAESSLKLNDSKYKPQIYVGADGSYSSPGYDLRADLDPNYAVYATVSVPLFEWGKRRNEKRASRQKIGIAKDNLNEIQDKVNLEIQTARLCLSQAMEQVKLSQQSLEKAHENERQAMERYNEGEISIVEVIEAQTYRQSAEINHVQAKATAQGQYSALIKALNLYK